MIPHCIKIYEPSDGLSLVHGKIKNAYNNFVKAIPCSSQKQRKLKIESEFNRYKCFKIMTLNQCGSRKKRGAVKIYGGGSRKCFKNILQYCMYLALNVLCIYV